MTGPSRALRHSSGPLLGRLSLVLGFGQTRSQDPNELGRRLRADLGSGVYLRVRFAEHDHWTVAFYKENPDNTQLVAVVPISRSNDALRRLGAAGGVKRSFPVDFYVVFNPDNIHIDQIAWSTMPESVTQLCP